jgi:protein TonB
MSAALIYKPSARWRMPVALLCAAFVHVAAVVVAERWPTEPPFADVADEPTEITVEPELTVTTSPQLIEEIPPPAPVPPEVSETFVEEIVTAPAPMRSVPKPAPPLIRRSAPGSVRPSSMTTARVMALSAPRPEYPYEARRQRLTGSGVAMLIVDFASGNVLDVRMVQSTGSAVLDNAAVSGFRRWHFKPGTVSKVQTPISFTLAGAAY